MQRLANLMLIRFTQDGRGAVIVEFAFALPILLLMYSGGWFVSDMIACNRKVTIATRSLVDLVTRSTSPAIVYNNPQGANATSYFSASAVVMSPYKLDNATEQVSLLRVCDPTHAYVVWTRAQTQNATGSTVTPTTSTHTAGTLPASEAQLADSVILIPANMITAPMVPISPDGSNVCQNLALGSSNKIQVGTAGGWLYTGNVKYKYTPTVSHMLIGTTIFIHTIYMVPRLY